MNVNPHARLNQHVLLTEKGHGIAPDGRLSAGRRSVLNDEFIESVDLLSRRGRVIRESDDWKKAVAKAMRNDIASDTFQRPRGREAIHKLLDGIMASKDLVMSKEVSAADLARVHSGSSSVANASHLHPYQPGLSTKNRYSDEDKITVLWRYPEPKPGQLHPDPIYLTDGSLVAAFLTKEAGDLKAFHAYEPHVLDYLNGNKHALKTTGAKRVARGVQFRFQSYCRGMKEGLTVPRFNGSIGANLLVTSLPISAGLYAIFYCLDYVMTKERLNDHHDAVKMLTQSTGSSGNSTYSLSS